MTKFCCPNGSTTLVVPAATAIGAVGYRCLSDSCFIVAIQTSSLDALEHVALKLAGGGWQADSQSRTLSRQVDGTYEDLKQALARVVAVLYVGGEISINEDAPHWVRSVIADTVEEARSLYGRLRERISVQTPTVPTLPVTNLA